MTAVFRLTCFAVLLSLSPCAAAAQEPAGGVERVAELVLKDGSRMYGAVEAESDAEVLFRTTGGALVRAPRPDVVSLRQVTGVIVAGEFRRDDPNRTRLLFAPTARSLRRGEVYLGVYETVVPFVQVGVTDRLSIGGGTPLIFNLSGSERLFWVTPKLQVYSGSRADVSVGVFHGTAAGENAGIAYGVVTREAAGGAFTAGMGMAYTGDGSHAVVVMAGGESAPRRNLKLVTENYVWGSTAVASGAVRFFGDHLSADLGVAAAFTDDGAFAFPVVNFVYRF